MNRVDPPMLRYAVRPFESDATSADGTVLFIYGAKKLA